MHEFTDNYGDRLHVYTCESVETADNFYIDTDEGDTHTELSFRKSDAPAIAAAILEAGGYSDLANLVKSKQAVFVEPESDTVTREEFSAFVGEHVALDERLSAIERALRGI